MKYLFDTNIFIRSKNEMPMHIWPTFWTRMTELIKSGVVFSCEKVKQEIERGNDELTIWIKDNAPSGFYIGFDAEVAEKYQQTQEWAESNRNLTPNAKRDFADVADAYLVATAAAKGMTLVTYETSNPESKKRVKIPDACNALDVPYCDLNAAFIELGVRI